MGQLVLKDNAASTLSVTLTATAGSGQTVTIAGNGAKFPTVTGTDWSYITVFDGAGNIEPMKVTAHAVGATSFTVSRGTSAGITGITDADVKSWTAGTSTGVACRLVSQVVVDINAAATSAAASAASAAAVATSISDHIADTSAAHAASAISYAGSSNLSSTDVEAALDELDAEKQPIDANTAKLNVAQSWTAKQTFGDTNFEIVDNGDATKKVVFETSGITTATTRTVTIPNKSGTLAMTSDIVSGITPLTAKASTSGTSINFTGIPSSTKRVTVMFDGVTTNGSSNLLIRVGDSGGIENTGYQSVAADRADETQDTSGFILSSGNANSTIVDGAITLSTLNSSTNTWVMSGSISGRDVRIWVCAGSKSLSAALTQLSVTTVNGTDTFDGGSINVMYEL